MWRVWLRSGIEFWLFLCVCFVEDELSFGLMQCVLLVMSVRMDGHFALFSFVNNSSSVV